MINEEIITKVPEVFRDGDYWLAADGKIYRGEEPIATRDELGAVAYVEGMERYKNRVGRLLNGVSAALGEEAVSSASASVGSWPPEQSGVPSGPSDDSPSQSVVVPAEPAPSPKPEEKPPCKGKELTFEQIMRDYPQGAPATDWRGDLTPDFVEWYFEHYPERAKLRYEARGLRPVVHEVLAKLQLSIY